MSVPIHGHSGYDLPPLPDTAQEVVHCYLLNVCVEEGHIGQAASADDRRNIQDSLENGATNQEGHETRQL